MTQVWILVSLCPLLAWADGKGGVVKLERVAVGDAYAPKVLGLFIGIQEYEDPIWHDLDYPRKDVADMVSFFSSGNALYLDYHLALTTPRDTTRDYILNHAMEAFAMKNTSSEDLVVVYISSHGTLTNEQLTVIKDGAKVVEPRKVPYILTSDAREGKVPDSAIALHKMLDWFEHLPSSRKVMILDMCHSGIAGKSQLSPGQARLLKSAKGVNYVPLEDSSAAIVLASCPMGSSSFEDDRLKNSVYTHFLLEGMREGDMNGDGAVTISEAHNYAIDKTRTYTWEHKQYRQVPTTYSKILGKDPIVVSGKPRQPGNPTVFSYASVNQGVEIFVDGAYKGMLPKGIQLSPGKRHVALKYEGRTIYKTRIEARKGTDYMLPDVARLKPAEKKRPTVFLLLEGGQRGFQRGSVPTDLLPDTPIGGFSLHWLGSLTKWGGLSLGAEYGGNDDVQEVGFRIGLKLNTPSPGLRLSVGPELLFLFLTYSDELADDENVSSDNNFVAPGLEALLTYEFQGGVALGAGLRAHYLPYDYDDGTENAWANQALVSIGYAF
jgi:uncharacterized caspase-like protein